MLVKVVGKGSFDNLTKRIFGKSVTNAELSYVPIMLRVYPVGVECTWNTKSIRYHKITWWYWNN